MVCFEIEKLFVGGPGRSSSEHHGPDLLQVSLGLGLLAALFRGFLAAEGAPGMQGPHAFLVFVAKEGVERGGNRLVGERRVRGSETHTEPLACAAQSV
jgi:hypothetical protein